MLRLISFVLFFSTLILSIAGRSNSNIRKLKTKLRYEFPDECWWHAVGADYTAEAITDASAAEKGQTIHAGYTIKTQKMFRVKPPSENPNTNTKCNYFNVECLDVEKADDTTTKSICRFPPPSLAGEMPPHVVNMYKVCQTSSQSFKANMQTYNSAPAAIYVKCLKSANDILTVFRKIYPS